MAGANQLLPLAKQADLGGQRRARVEASELSIERSVTTHFGRSEMIDQNGRFQDLTRH
jgi:hypothetical protein